MKEHAVQFPDGRKADADVSAGDVKTVEERVCINCGGEPRHISAMAKAYTVVRCPKCEMLYPGEPVQ